MLGHYVDKFNKKDKFFFVGYNSINTDNQVPRVFEKAKRLLRKGRSMLQVVRHQGT